MGTVSADNTRIDESSGSSSASNIGGGSGSGGEPDIRYQGTADRSRKVGTSASGFALTPAATNISNTGTYQTLMLKVAAGNWAALDPVATPGLQFRIGSAASAYHRYDVMGSDNYPEKGGFVFFPIDPNIAGYRASTSGNPSLTAADYFGVVGDFNATSKSENLVLSAVDVGDGLTISGTGGEWNDFAVFNSVIGNRHGYFFALEGVTDYYGVYGTMVISAANFDDSGKTLVFLDTRAAAGWSGISMDAAFSLSDNKYDSRGNTTTTDTRAIYTCTASATGTHLRDTFKGFASLTLRSSLTMSACVFEQCGQITANDADFSGSSFLSPAGTLLWDTANDPASNLTNTSFVSAGTGHALELGTTSPLSITLSGVSFTGYASSDGSTGNEAVWVRRTGGTVTLNVVSGSTPSVRTDGATVNVVSGNLLTLTGLQNPTEVRVFDAGTTTELAGQEVVSSGTFSTSLQAASVDISILSLGFQNIRLIGISMAGDVSIPVQQIVDRQYQND